MNRLKLLVSLIFFFFLLFAVPSKAMAAPRIFFDPSTITAVQNNQFTIQLKIDAEANQVIGSDVIISYAGADLDVVSVTNGSFFPEFHYASNGSDRIELHGYVTSIYQTKTGAGTLATLTFNALKGTGSSALTMSCHDNGNQTNILNDSGNTILSCGSLNQVAISYSGTANTPTPTTPAGSTATPTPTQGSSNTLPTCTSLAAAVTSAQGTPQAIGFTCSGADPDGYVNAAEFTFGDGTKQVVEKNVGGQGSLTTTHTFTSIGTFGASCRVRDNNNVYSSVPNSCKQTITIRPRPTNAPVGGSNIYRTPTPTRASGATATRTPTPTVQVVTIISVTPFPTFAAYPSPTLYPDEETDVASSRFWWIVGGALSLLLAYLLLRKKKPPQKPTQPTSVPPIIIQENTAQPKEPPPTI